MKSITKIIPLALMFTLIGCNRVATERISVPDVTREGTVVILGTGGTIAGSGEEGKETGYKSGSISVESLIEAIPGIEDIAPLEAVQICNINSDDVTSKIWIRLTKYINAYAADPEVAGIVVLHGTDTMEETAYFLNLTVNTDKPVVITGSMRPATAISPDGPMNLYQSVVVAANKESKGKGVIGVFSDHIYSARSMKKISTCDVMAISAGNAGALGYIRNDDVFFYQESSKKHTIESEFTKIIKDELTYLPMVSTIYFQVDADPSVITAASGSNAGIVIAGAGAGEFSEGFIKAIDKITIPVVISSRIDEGIITQDSVLCNNTVAANDLPPQKAAILLRLAIAAGTASKDQLIEIYKRY